MSYKPVNLERQAPAVDCRAIIRKTRPERKERCPARIWSSACRERHHSPFAARSFRFFCRSSAVDAFRHLTLLLSTPPFCGLVKFRWGPKISEMDPLSPGSVCFFVFDFMSFSPNREGQSRRPGQSSTSSTNTLPFDCAVFMRMYTSVRACESACACAVACEVLGIFLVRAFGDR